MKAEFKGVFSAIVTPFDASAGLDEAGLRAIVSEAIEAGVDGFAPTGSTGEFTSLTTAERKRVVEIVVDEAAGRAPVVPQIGALTTTDAVDIAKHAAAAGADGIFAIAPFYEPLELDALRGYYEAIAAVAAIPVGIYNLPQATGVNLQPDWVGALARDVEPISFVKESTGDFTQLGRLVKDHGDELTVFNGADTMLLAAFDLGAEAAIVGAPNIVPEACAAIYDAWSEGRHDEAADRLDGIYPLLQLLLSGAYYPAIVKTALKLIGKPGGVPRPPVRLLDGARREELRSVLDQIGSLAAA